MTPTLSFFSHSFLDHRNPQILKRRYQFCHHSCIVERDSLCQNILVWQFISLEIFQFVHTWKHMDNTDVIHRVVEKNNHSSSCIQRTEASFYFTYIYFLFYLYILRIIKIQLHKTTKDSNFRVLPHTHKYTNPCILIQEVCLENYVSSPLVVVKRGS